MSFLRVQHNYYKIAIERKKICMEKNLLKGGALLVDRLIEERAPLYKNITFDLKCFNLSKCGRRLNFPTDVSVGRTMRLPCPQIQTDNY